MSQAKKTYSITRVKEEENARATDVLAVEEPLEIRLEHGMPEARQRKSVAVTMRTPGNDEELAAGFLLTEGILEAATQIEKIERPTTVFRESWDNLVQVVLKPGEKVDLQQIERHFYTTSSCGVCGKASVEAVQQSLPAMLPGPNFRISADLIFELPLRLERQQKVFQSTGGLHAAALFDLQANLLMIREDVGRHNALDKLIGAFFLEDRLPLPGTILLVSGRASFELVQKALMAGIPALAAVGAPSSLAVQLAEENGMTLIGFLREKRFNIYTGEERIGDRL